MPASPSPTKPGPLRAGIDTGGTFTDLFLDPGASGQPPIVVKVPSTPSDPSEAIASGLAELGQQRDIPDLHIVHGTTVGLNALLTRNLAATALVTNRGFRDLIEIGRQDRPDIYALHPQRPAPVVPRHLRFEIDQRSWPDPKTGTLVQVQKPRAKDLATLANRIRKSGAKSIAICLLHSWADPSIEQHVAAALAKLGLPITTSASLVPEFREYERFSTATVNAALAPIVGDYLQRLGTSIADIGLGDARLSLMQSGGGTTSPERAATEPARVLLSGPAGGVLGAVRAAAEAGLGDIVTLDMGGTSTDVAFHSPARASGSGRAGEAALIGGLPVALPSLDVHTIGCGGGSLAFVDGGGALHVGPKSAGAHPGPVAYGNSDQLTLTDAHIFQGHIVTEHEQASLVAGSGFLGGSLALDIDGVTRAFEKLGKRLGVRPHAAAAAMIEIGRAAMGRATGAMTMQRGRDPRGLSLVAFGGAGGLVAAELAAAMDISRVLIPADPGVLSARGLAQAGFRGDASRSLLQPLDNLPKAERLRFFRELRDELFTLAAGQGIAIKDTSIEFTLDLRYQGQSFELGVAAGSLQAGKRGPAALATDVIAEAFFAQHERLYGHRLESNSIEVVNLRAVAREQQAFSLPPKPRKRALGLDPIAGTGKLRIGKALVQAPILARAAMRPGMGFAGPAIVLEYSGTTVVPPEWSVRVTGGGHLLLSSESGI